MPLRTILKFPDPLVKKISEPVKDITDEIAELLTDMAETMYNAPGVGLAAPQIGILKRIAVIDISKEGEPKNLITIINPEIIEKSGETEEEEGCLCVPGIYAPVKRNSIVVVKALNENGKPFEIKGEGLLARALQHEIDHLNGTLFIDRVSSLRRSLLIKKFKKNERENQN